MQDDHYDSRLDAQKRRLHQRHVPVGRIESDECGNHKRARQDEQQPRDHAASDTPQTPSGIGGQLHRLGSGQQHAQRQGAQETLFVQPIAFFHQLFVHQGNLRGGAAK